jgi:hypothetical protein
MQVNPHNKSFAQALCGSINVDNTNLPVPSIKGGRLCIKIEQEEYGKGITDCQRKLWGCLVLNKGDNPYTTRFLNQKLTKVWNTIQFDNYDDLCMVWAKGTVNLTSGVFRLSKWKKEFNWYLHQQNDAQVWVKIIASVIGTPLTLYSSTKNRVSGVRHMCFGGYGFIKMPLL